MPTLSSLSMLGLDELTWPVSYRFVEIGSHGWTQTELSLNIPVLNGNHDKTIAAGPTLWQAIVAPATTSSTQLIYFECLIHHEAPLPVLSGASLAFGLQPGTPAARDHSGVLLLHSGHPDELAVRRIFAYGMPAAWTDGETLNDAGWDHLMAWAHGVYMGAAADFIGGTMQLLHMYPRVLPVVPENLNGVAFRRVSDLRVCNYVDKAPDLFLGIWP